MSIADVLGNRIAGIQLGIFETVWRRFECINGIFFGMKESKIDIYICTEIMINESDAAKIKTMMDEMMYVMIPDLRIGYNISFQISRPCERGYLEIMSHDIFDDCYRFSSLAAGNRSIKQLAK